MGSVLSKRITKFIYFCVELHLGNVGNVPKSFFCVELHLGNVGNVPKD